MKLVVSIAGALATSFVRQRQRAPNVRPLDRLVLGFNTIFIGTRRILKLVIAVRPATIPKFHRAIDTASSLPRELFRAFRLRFEGETLFFSP